MNRKKPEDNGAKLRALRKQLNLNQLDFWAPMGVTQSGGSRYESGRPLPKPLRILMALVYGTRQEQQRTMKRLKSRMRPSFD